MHTCTTHVEVDGFEVLECIQHPREGVLLRFLQVEDVAAIGLEGVKQIQKADALREVHTACRGSGVGLGLELGLGLGSTRRFPGTLQAQSSYEAYEGTWVE